MLRLRLNTVFGVLVLLFSLATYDTAPLSANNCPLTCTCDLTLNVLKIKCLTAQPNFQLPSVTIDQALLTATDIIATGSLIQSFPTNICTYPSLIALDLSENLISGTLQYSYFSCLTGLKTLKMNRNSITAIASNAFNSLSSLEYLELTKNQIQSIPKGLFGTHLYNLAHVYLSNNTITEMEMWPLNLVKINYVDLRYNNIQRFTNTHGFSIQTTIPSTPYLASIDLRFNQITTFDDITIQQYGVCSLANFQSFVTAIKTFWLTSNPLYCNCSSSQLLRDFTLFQFNVQQNLYTATCQYPFALNGKFWYNFQSTCPTSSNPYQYCTTTSTTTTTTSTTTTTTTSTTTTTTTTTITTTYVTTASLSQITGAQVISDGTIAGIVLCCIGFLLILLLILICLCHTECAACCFMRYPGCYHCFCKCCHREYLDPKHYDLFISYNIDSKCWVKTQLVRIIERENLVRNYYLHYNEKENSEMIIYPPLINEKLENTSHILLVLSDKFLDKEWNHIEFRTKIRKLVSSGKVTITCIQMTDVTDDEVEEFVRKDIQKRNLRSFEIDEFCFWTKLKYFLKKYRNRMDVAYKPLIPKPPKPKPSKPKPSKPKPSKPKPSKPKPSKPKPSKPKPSKPKPSKPKPSKPKPSKPKPPKPKPTQSPPPSLQYEYEMDYSPFHIEDAILKNNRVASPSFLSGLNDNNTNKLARSNIFGNGLIKDTRIHTSRSEKYVLHMNYKQEYQFN